MYIKTILGIMLLFVFSILSYANIETTEISQLSIPFIENKGQFPKYISFYVNGLNYSTIINKNASIQYFLKNASFSEIFETKDVSVIEPLKEAKTTINYFKGKKHFSHLKTFKSVEVKNIANGIDLELRAYAQKVEKIFKIKPGFSPSEIKVNLKGIKDIKVNSNGELELLLGKETAKFTKPIAYQFINGKKKLVKVSYKKLDNDSYSFVVGNYDKSKTLFIDPVLSSILIGGSDEDIVSAMNINENGDIYLSCTTRSIDFPVKNGIFQSHNGEEEGDRDILILKIKGDFSELISATYLGGSDLEKSSNIVFDSNGNVIVAGSSYSSDFPTTKVPVGEDPSNNSNWDIVLAKFSPDLSQLLESVKMGGSLKEKTTDLKIYDDMLYVYGFVKSIDFPTTSGSYRSVKTGQAKYDLFIMKLDKNFDQILASTYIGGVKSDIAYRLYVDKDFIYGVGYTSSDDFAPEMNGLYKSYGGGVMEGFVFKMTKDLSQLKSATYIGGTGLYDRVLDIDVQNNRIYIVGFTDSENFPVTDNAIKKKLDGVILNTGNIARDSYVMILDKDLKSLIASTLIGGSNNDNLNRIKLDSQGYIYVSGFTHSNDFPTTKNALVINNSSEEGYVDGIFVKLNPELSEIEYSTYLGGRYKDSVFDFYISEQYIYISGTTNSHDFKPLLLKKIGKTGSGELDIFLLKLSIDTVKKAKNHSNGCVFSSNSSNLLISLILIPMFILFRKRLKWN